MTNESEHVALPELDAIFQREGFRLAGSALEGMAAYLSLLMKWNAAMNLVGATDWRKAASNLVMDSLHLAAFMDGLPLPVEPETWDLGAGAGLPGIPLRLLWRRGRYTMVEAREKRALFLRITLASLELRNTLVAKERVESFFTHAGQADCILSRAFMPWPKLLDLVAPSLAPGGLVVLLTLEPVDAAMPDTWRVRQSVSYDVSRQTRYFSALERVSDGS